MNTPSITVNVMIGTALLGATAGTIGTFAVLRRRALVGDGRYKPEPFPRLTR